MLTAQLTAFLTASQDWMPEPHSSVGLDRALRFALRGLRPYSPNRVRQSNLVYSRVGAGVAAVFSRTELALLGLGWEPGQHRTPMIAGKLP
jgi:hypothetical protein